EKEESLDHLDRDAAGRAVDLSETISDKGQDPPPPILGMKIPRGGERRQAADLALAPQRQRQAKETPHTVPDDADGRPGDFGCRPTGRLKSFHNVEGQVEITPLNAWLAQIDDERPQTRTREMAQKAALGQKIKNIVRLIREGMTRPVGPSPLPP